MHMELTQSGTRTLPCNIFLSESLIRILCISLFLINSPVVRGDTLRFREDGVKDVISRVFLPWVNSFRFLLGQISLLKKENDIDFKWDPNARKSDNVMDRWMLASCQTLITFVKTEMEGIV